VIAETTPGARRGPAIQLDPVEVFYRDRFADAVRLAHLLSGDARLLRTSLRTRSNECVTVSTASPLRLMPARRATSPPDWPRVVVGQADPALHEARRRKRRPRRTRRPRGDRLLLEIGLLEVELAPEPVHHLVADVAVVAQPHDRSPLGLPEPA
jgi:hypothetical protein